MDPDLLRVTWQQLAFVEEREPPTWSLVARLRLGGADGVRVPSIQAQGFNLALWRWNEEGEAKVVALDPLRDLPIAQSSWKSPRASCAETGLARRRAVNIIGV